MTLATKTRTPRQSNMELLRIIAMLMILVLHANYKSFGAPTAADYAQAPVGEFLRTFAETLAIVGVDIFVMISGWFGIKPSLRGFGNFLFQVVFFYSIGFATVVALGIMPFSVSSLGAIFCLADNGWFVLAYIGLYAVAPLLNMFIEKATREQVEKFLIWFFVIQCIWGWIGNSSFYLKGASTLSFIGLYILAAYVRKYHLETLRAVKIGGGYIFLIISLSMAIAIAICQYLNLPAGMFLLYSSPTVIIAALALVWQFSQFNLGSNKLINFIAASAFSVYLLHDSIFTSGNLYIPGVRWSFENFGLGGVILLIVGVYVLAILLDQIRKFIWRLLIRS